MSPHARSLFLQYFVDTAQTEAETHQPPLILDVIFSVEQLIHSLCIVTEVDSAEHTIPVR